MVNNTTRSLDLVFSALSDATRRQMLRTLARGDRRVSELAKPHDISLPAISKHLDVLERAGLIRRRREGRAQYVQLRTGRLRRASRWIGFYERFWSTHLDDLEELLTPPTGQRG
jgi:DNA-binding transcriptional ArsR family regulator